MKETAIGTFEVKMIPESQDVKTGSTLGRMMNEKKFSGDLEAESSGQMLTAMTDIQGSAGYVLIERVTGTLKGKKGTFVLQHNATMNRGIPYQEIVVVPDSGTEELAGLEGTLGIDITEDGVHHYTFEYSFIG